MQKNLLTMQAGDVVATYADIEDLQRAVGFAPRSAAGRRDRKVC
jgi:UDP-glucuronate 4-epimerase